PRVGDQPAAPRAVGRRAPGQRRLAVPGAAQARTGRLDQSRVEDDREQSEGEVLRADAARQEAARNGGGELEAAVLRDLARRPTIGNLRARGRLSAAAFSMVDGLILRPYPVPHSRDLVDLVSTARDNAFDAFSYREYVDIRRLAKSYDGVIASTDVLPVGFSAEPGTPARIKAGMLVSGDYFRVLGS